VQPPQRDRNIGVPIDEREALGAVGAEELVLRMAATGRLDKPLRYVHAGVAQCRAVGTPDGGKAAGAAAHVDERSGIGCEPRQEPALGWIELIRSVAMTPVVLDKVGVIGPPVLAGQVGRSWVMPRYSADRPHVTSTTCICADSDELAERSAERIAGAANEAVAQRGRFTLCLSGGDTPAATYARLGSERVDEIPWRAVHVFWGDERCIPLERPDNHFTMATELMLSRVPIPPENVHRARGEAPDPAAAATEYEALLRGFFNPGDGGVPIFDLVLLGMGEDGHVASLFPGSAGWRERDRWAVDHYVIKRGERVRRLTLTMPLITAAREVMILVSGEHKADAVAGVLQGTVDLPAAQVNAEASCVRWMLDAKAAGALDRGLLTPRAVAT
jgi:6-phosphogluconolactonase